MADKPEVPTPKNISDIVADLDYVQTNRQPTIEHYLGIDKYFTDISKATKIIHGYVDGTSLYEPAQMQEDCLVLAAIRVQTAEMVGYLEGYAQRAENSRKITKSKYAISIKRKHTELEKAHSVTIKVTDPDVDNASRVLASELYLEADDAQTICNMMKSAWYAIGDFTKILDRAIQRSHQENFDGNASK